jgi:hypothetical protein
MKRISCWARDHVWSSRLLIIFLIYPLLNLTGWWLGIILNAEGLQLNPAWGYPLSFICLLLFVLYPSRQNKTRFKNLYAYRKTIDILMGCITFCFILITGNHFTEGFAPGTISTAATISEEPAKTGTSSVKKEKKGLKKFIQNIRRAYKNSSNGEKTGMIILAVIVAVLLVTLLGGLSCSIACNGSEGLGYAVFFIGLGAIVFALVKIIHRITNGPKKKAEPLKTS